MNSADNAANQDPIIDYGVTGNDAADRFERIWAPYRQAYFAKEIGAEESAAEELTENSTQRPSAGSQPEKQSDPFLSAPTRPDEESHIVARGKTVYAILNLYPYNAGHMMVIPYRKVANLEDLSTQEANELMAFTRMAVRVLKRVCQPDACNIGMNLGKAAGGSIGDHIHMHIVPRWVGDTSFMPIIGGTKVMPDTLHHTWKLMSQAWKAIEGEDHNA